MTLQLLALLCAYGQRTRAISIPMTATHWDYEADAVAFIIQDGKPAIQMTDAAVLKLKGHTFANGTIEYDVALGKGFPGITFRTSDDWKNGDHFYLRYFGASTAESRTTMQYTAMLDGMSMWDLTDEYQAATLLQVPGWNHVKLVISAHQLRAYVNDMDHPALQVPLLEGVLPAGGILFSGGEATIANMVLHPDAVEDLPATPGYVSTCNDSRYLRNWQVTSPQPFPFGEDLVLNRYTSNVKTTLHLPDSTTSWQPITAEARGHVNLNRVFGSLQKRGRRLAWLQTALYADLAKEVRLRLGFSDEVWVWVNGQPVFTDKNIYGTPLQKFPEGRCTLENSTLVLPLKAGKNNIMIALSNDFYGWGLIARLDDTDDIHFQPGDAPVKEPNRGM